MSFKEYLAQRKPRHDAEGDFVRLALADPTFPDVSSWGEIEAHLVSSKATYPMINAARDVWDKHQKVESRTRAA